MNQAEAQAAVMVTAHESWERKRDLEQQAYAALMALADNVYTEYSTFRGCTQRAAYDEAITHLERVMEVATQKARDGLGAKVLDARRRNR